MKAPNDCVATRKSKFGQISVSELKRDRERDAENAKLKRINGDLALEDIAPRD